MDIITLEPIKNRSLRRDCLQSRMSGQSSHSSIKTRIGHSGHANRTTCRYIIDYPFNCVVSIRSFIYLTSCLFRYIRTYIHELALTHISATDILKHNHIAISKKLLHIRSQIILPSLSVRSTGIRSPDKQHWRFISEHRLINSGIKPHTIPHRDHNLTLRIVILKPLRIDYFSLLTPQQTYSTKKSNQYPSHNAQKYSVNIAINLKIVQ